VAKRGKVKLLLVEGYFFLGKDGRFNKWRGINSERGGEEGIENQKLQSIKVALRLLSPCSEVALFQQWKHSVVYWH
jgi:hypothetical protein